MTDLARPAERVPSAPVLNPEAQAWFDASAEGRLVVRRCAACGLAHHYPRSVCPHCFSDATVWIESAGRGEIYSFSTLLRGTAHPYCIAYVTLDEGVTLLTNIVDCDFSTLAIGRRVALRFTTAEGGARVAMFTPEDTAR
ncbi:OB-fold domain-containing protein [soil metagenome]